VKTEKIKRAKRDVPKVEYPACIGSFFLDSGAFSLYTKLVLKRDPKDTGPSGYDSPEFWEYVDRYAAFIKAHERSVDYYANIDAIGDAETTWKVHKYLEKKHGLRPIPVIHFGEPHKWIQFYIDKGYDLIAFGGLARRHLVGKEVYHAWLDKAFESICPVSNDRKPIVRVHGFAVTNYNLLIRYPWWSVDSASWVKAGGFGTIYVPRRKNGKFTFSYLDGGGIRQPVFPYSISASTDSPSMKKRGGLHPFDFGRGKAVCPQVAGDYGHPLGECGREGGTEGVGGCQPSRRPKDCQPQVLPSHG